MWTPTLYLMSIDDAPGPDTLIAVWAPAPYRGGVSTDRHSTPRRNIGIDDELWAAYGEVVGDGGRSDDIRDYVVWRVENPDTPLPGRFRGPVKKVRRRSEKAD